MSDRVRWIEHQGLKILFEDFSSSSEDEFVKAIQAAERMMLESGDKIIYVLADSTDIRMTDPIKQAAETLVINTKAQGITLQTSMAGLSKLQRIIANAIKRDIYFSKDKEDGKEWLIKQSEKVKNKQPVG